jgi:antitoxin component of MazEF toxin-antitoxin module
MIRRLTKQGNSWVFVFDRTIRDLMKIEEGTFLNVSLEGRRLIIEPMSPEEREKKFQQALDETNSEYAADLRNLAK